MRCYSIDEGIKLPHGLYPTPTVPRQSENSMEFCNGVPRPGNSKEKEIRSNKQTYCLACN